MLSLRHALVAAVLGCAALTLTACEPDDTGAADGTVPTASASPGAKGACPTLAPGHAYVKVESVSGAMNTLTTKGATQRCNPDEGAFYQANGKEHAYVVESGDTPVTVIHMKEKGAGRTTAAHGGLQHIRVCVNGTAQDTDTAKADTGDCYGQNYFDVAVGGDGKITEMTELYGS
ncbi:hypothetical protein ACF09H_00130 [Streptomyces sp. NPDC014983]|uniref:hypothetical protein n=1 Tax=unclassified Streptomyces TaxID=2593676 RepID=UPI0033231E07